MWSGCRAIGGFQGPAPVVEGEPGDRKHQVDVHRRHAGFAQGADRLRGLGGVVLAAEGFEDVRGEGLDAERDAGDAEFAEQPRFRDVEGGGVGFQRDLVERGEVEDFTEPAEELAEVGGREHRGRAAAEVEGARLFRETGDALAGFL